MGFFQVFELETSSSTDNHRFTSCIVAPTEDWSYVDYGHAQPEAVAILPNGPDGNLNVYRQAIEGKIQGDWPSFAQMMRLIKEDNIRKQLDIGESYGRTYVNAKGEEKIFLIRHIGSAVITPQLN